MSASRSWLYLLQAGEMFKIGITGSSVCGRIKQLQTGCPHKINLVCAVRLEEADGAEKELHHRLKGVREQGEWFRLNPLSITRLIATMGSFVGAQVWERSKGTATVEMPEVDVDGDWLIDYIDASVMAWARFNLSSEGDKS